MAKKKCRCRKKVGRPRKVGSLQTKLKHSGKKILYNTSQIQDIKSSACGWYCYYFITMRSKGKSFYDIIQEFSIDPSKNDMILKKFLK